MKIIKGGHARVADREVIMTIALIHLRDGILQLSFMQAMQVSD